MIHLSPIASDVAANINSPVVPEIRPHRFSGILKGNLWEVYLWYSGEFWIAGPSRKFLEPHHHGACVDAAMKWFGSW